MRKLSFAQATMEAMAEEMRRDPAIFAIGEDIATNGGPFGQFKGLSAQFPGRILDAPISETAIVGASVGAALAGMHPVTDMHFADFIGIAMDEILNQMAKARYMFGGQAGVPMVLRVPDGLTFQAGAQHSQSLEAWFIHIPGLRVVTPSNTADAKALLKAALRSRDPVVFFENKILFKEVAEVCDICDEKPMAMDKAKVERTGSDCTVVSYSISMRTARAAADMLSKEGISCELIDLVSLSPIDLETVLASVRKTHRLCIVHEAVKQGGAGAEVAALAAEYAIDYLDAPILRFGAPFVPVPFSPSLEKGVRVYPQDVAQGIRGMM